MSWITLSFLSWSILCTSATSSLVLILVAGFWVVVWLLLPALIVVSSPSVACALESLSFSGQYLLMCPWCLHLKHLPSHCSLVCSLSLRAANAQVHPGVVSMALGSLANPFCHCCFEGRFPCPWLLNSFHNPCLHIHFFCSQGAPSIQCGQVKKKSICLCLMIAS